MAVTVLNDLIDPQVMADAISAELPKAIKFSPLAKMDDTLKEKAGSTITIPKFAYIGDAADVAEGQPIDIVKLTASTSSAKVKKAGKGVEVTDEALFSGYGDPEGEAKDQLKLSIASKVDNDCVDALGSIPVAMTVDKAADILKPASLSAALVKFGEAIYDSMVLLIAPEQLDQLRTSPEFIRASELGDKILMTGVIGAVYGCQIIVSGKIKAVTDKFTNYIIKPGALTIYRKKDVDLETGRDIVHKTTIITADQHYIVVLSDESKAIKLITKATL